MLRLLILLALSLPSYGQTLPPSATPRGVVYVFLSETASTIDSINRKAFRERLTGEMSSVDPETFKGLVPAGGRFVIDSIPDLASVDDEDSLRRTVAYVHVTTNLGSENWYLFCAGDSIWRIEALKRFPTALQAAQIRASLKTLDTGVAGYALLHGDLRRLLADDDSLCALFRRNAADVQKILDPLRKGTSWRSFAIRDVDFALLEEYRELDDDIDRSQRVFYSMNRIALERLKRTIGLQRIERDERFPDDIFFVVGTAGAGSSGFVYIHQGGALPPVSRHEFIVLKPAAPNWWLFKRIPSRR